MSCSIADDRSETFPPEVDVFDELTPKPKETTYGSDEHEGFLKAMGAGLQHHYESNDITRSSRGTTVIRM